MFIFSIITFQEILAVPWPQWSLEILARIFLIYLIHAIKHLRIIISKFQSIFIIYINLTWILNYVTLYKSVFSVGNKTESSWYVYKVIQATFMAEVSAICKIWNDTNYLHLAFIFSRVFSNISLICNVQWA